jgi:hypothetical protein
MSISPNGIPRKHRRTARLAALLATVTLVLVLGVVFTQASRQGQGKLKTPKAAPRVSDGKSYVATREIHVDQQTGATRKPTPAETQELVATLRQLTSRSTEGLSARTHSDGTKQVSLEGRFGAVVLARPRGDGSMETHCVTSFEEAADFLGLVEAGAEQAQ